MTDPPARETPQVAGKATQLETLAIFHYVYGGFSMLLMGAAVALVPLIVIPSRAFESDPFLLVPFGLVGMAFLLALAFAVLNVFCGYWLQRRRHWTVCLVTACFNCASFPGIVLGVFTIVLLVQPEVKAQFR